MESNYNFDLFVIGGGPGGIAAAKEASIFGKKIGIADYVKPSPRGTKWEIGGTCVNVGCIPKKMMHFAATILENFKFLPYMGYEDEIKKKLSWEKLVENIQIHIKSLNFGYRTQLRSKKVKFYKKLAKLIDKHTIELTDSKGKTETITSDMIIIAVGGRPNYPNIIGAKELCITSDDLFYLKKPPGKTLIVGASYIALETAGLLNTLGFDVTIMVRSILLRGFDSDMSKRLGDILAKNGVKFLYKCCPVKFSKENENEISVEYENLETKEQKKDIFETVLLAVGRVPETKNLGLELAHINLAKSGKIEVDEFEKTSVANIYSIGDCAEGRPELAPPAIMAAKLLVRRLFNGEKKLMDYVNIPTTIYTPIEYGSCGLSEEKAKELYGDKIKVYHSEFTPVEWTFDTDSDQTCYVKVIVNTSDNNRVVGFHIFGPNAGEITQGIAISVKCGLTKDQLDSSVGIHPTIAEEITILNVTKDEGDGKKTGC